MRPVLQNQPQIEALSQPLVQALRNILAAIQTGWQKQHNGDGGHTAITASSLVSPILNIGAPLIISGPVNGTLNLPRLSSCVLVAEQTTLDVHSIYYITVQGQPPAPGHVLWLGIGKSGNASLNFWAGGATGAGHWTHIEYDWTALGSGFPNYLDIRNCWVQLVYLPDHLGTYCWRLVGSSFKVGG